MTSDASAQLLVKKVKPEYPKDLQNQGVQGLVVLKIRISKQGDVMDVTLASGPPALAPYAINAVKQWKYKPFLLNGNPLMVDTEVHVNFKVTGSGSSVLSGDHVR